MPQLASHGGYVFVINSARHDIFEISEICIYIESKPVHGNPPATSDTHCADLSCIFVIGIEPYSGVAWETARRDSVRGKSLNDRFFQSAEVKMDVCEEIIQIENRVANYLPGAMIGDISSPVDLVV